MPTPDRFFDLQNFIHKDLFLLDQPVWESLKSLKSYLDSMDLGKIECAIPESVTLVNPEKIFDWKGFDRRTRSLYRRSLRPRNG